MRAGLLAGLGLIAIAGPLAAQPPTSAYTELNLERCRVIAQSREVESIAWRCPGRGGVALLVTAGDGRYDVDAGIDNGEWESLPELNDIGPRVEWRLRGGRPFAIIFRLVSADETLARRSVLLVETIGRPGRPGCQIAVIGGAVADANARARAEADARAARFRCGVDAAAEIGVR